jgi:hypothetical protein
MDQKSSPSTSHSSSIKYPQLHVSSPYSLMQLAMRPCLQFGISFVFCRVTASWRWHTHADRRPHMPAVQTSSNNSASSPGSTVERPALPRWRYPGAAPRGVQSMQQRQPSALLLLLPVKAVPNANGSLMLLTLLSLAITCTAALVLPLSSWLACRHVREAGGQGEGFRLARREARLRGSACSKPLGVRRLPCMIAKAARPKAHVEGSQLLPLGASSYADYW